MTTPDAHTKTLQYSHSSSPSSSSPVPPTHPPSVQSHPVPPLPPPPPAPAATLNTVSHTLSNESTPVEIYTVCTTWELLGSYSHLASVRRLKQNVSQYCSKNHLYHPRDAFKQHRQFTLHPDERLSRGQLIQQLDHLQQQHAALLQQHKALQQTVRDAQQSLTDAQHSVTTALRESDELRRQLADERQEASKVAEQHARLAKQHAGLREQHARCAQRQTEACERLYAMHHHSRGCTAALLNACRKVDDHAIDLALTWLNGEQQETVFVSALAMQTADVDTSLQLIDSRPITTGHVVVKVLHYSDHWAVAVWDRRCESVVFTIDSATLIHADSPQLIYFLNWVEAVLAAQLGRPAAAPLTVEQVECAQQDDVVSCGLYVIEFCRVLAGESITTLAAKQKLMEVKVDETRQLLFQLYRVLRPVHSAAAEKYEDHRRSQRNKRNKAK